MTPAPSGLTMIVHGAEAFDRGDVRLMKSCFPVNRIIVAGVMGRTAAEESAIECSCPGTPPSEIIMEQNRNRCFLLNHAKTAESGRLFGEIVARRLDGHGFVHVEASNGTVFCWDGGDRALSESIADEIGYAVEYSSSEEHTGSADHRCIRGCIASEPVLVNGIVIGRAISEMVEIGLSDGKIVPVSGIEPKEHGLEKLDGRISDLSKAWCKSGKVRDSSPVVKKPCRSRGMVEVIDHSGFDCYGLLHGETAGILSVGDDTTAVCGHICSHRGIPVLGITDGDGDGIVEPAFTSGSLVVMALDERDDDLGKEVASGMGLPAVYSWADFLSSFLRDYGERVEITMDLRKKN